MKERLDTVELKSGETMTVYKVVAPEGDYGLDLVDFLHGRGPFSGSTPWHRYLERVWRGELAEEVLLSFCVGELNGEVVGALGFSTPADTRDVCTWGHVVTQTDQRGKGIAKALTGYSVEEFRRIGGRAMYLGTGLRGAAHHVYESYGFRDYAVAGNGTCMRLVLDGDPETFDQRYFAPPPSLSIRELKVSDMPRFEALVNLPLWTVKSYADKAVGSRPYEGQFLSLWERVAAGKGDCRVLHAPDGRVFGAAWTSPGELGPFDAHLRVLDLVIHPEAAAEAGAAVRQVLDAGEAARVVSYAAEDDRLRQTSLQEAGFAREATLADRLRIEGRSLGLEIWSMTHS